MGGEWCWLLSSLRAESARAFTGRRCPHSGRGEDFLTGQLNFFTETAVTPERKVEKLFPTFSQLRIGLPSKKKKKNTFTFTFLEQITTFANQNKARWALGSLSNTGWRILYLNSAKDFWQKNYSPKGVRGEAPKSAKNYSCPFGKNKGLQNHLRDL